MSYTTRAPAPLLPATDADAAAVLLSLAHLPPSPMPSSTETSASSTPLMSPSPTSPVWISNNDTTAMEEQEDPTTRRSSHGGIRGSRGVMWTQAEEECLQAALRQYGTDFKKIYHYHGPMGQTDTRLARLSHLQLVNKYHNSVKKGIWSAVHARAPEHRCQSARQRAPAARWSQAQLQTLFSAVVEHGPDWDVIYSHYGPSGTGTLPLLEAKCARKALAYVLDRQIKLGAAPPKVIEARRKRKQYGINFDGNNNEDMALPSPPPSATHFTTSGLYSPALTPLPSPMVRPAPLAETVASSGVQYATTAAPQVIPAVQQPPPQLGAPGAPGSRGRYPAPPPLHLHLQRPFPPPISPNVASFPLPPSPLVDHTPGSPLLPSPRMLYPGSHVLNYHQHASAPNHSVYATATSLPPSPPPIVPMEPRFC